MEKRKETKGDTVEVARSSYQPSKAELEEDMRVDMSFEELAKATVCTVNVRQVVRPK